jgi:transcriptional regulator with XRE-family HTH domain
MTFGDWLKQARGEMTQDVVAERAGVSKSYIGLIESDSKIPRIPNAISLAQAVYRHPLEGLAAMAGDKYLKQAQTLLGVIKEDADGSKVRELIITEPDDIAFILTYLSVSKKTRGFIRAAVEMSKSVPDSNDDSTKLVVKYEDETGEKKAS